ncbi:hydantoinase/oxoprolinase family protein [Sphingomonas crocodyli]|uniref:Hydantoinase/oxoprolinase family protein n=1 Tax=Sphingomonas crocodyli TaxID=1979270 RepID=A0A437M5G7_9SPHN|nr:hydantoinase/oxoprolinase family protein [Sphingomonas crocodyli]RVT92919.1 hydantoinase/oxoprolinase family protein [Sphingomonas crocodyli]
MLYLSSDVGGTFTDLVLIDTENGNILVDKVPSSAGDGAAIITGIERLLAKAGLSISDLTSFIHASTIATNAWLERKGADVVLLVTNGFRDVLEIGDQRRPHTYGLTSEKRWPVVPRSKIIEVEERVDAFGERITIPDQATIDSIVAQLKEMNPQAVAISFLFSFHNDGNERLLADAIEAGTGQKPYLSCEINPQMGEFLRANTTAAAAYVGPELSAYLKSLTTKLSAVGFAAPLRLMCSNGGVAAPPSIEANPAAMLLSGPAGGAIASAELGRQIGAKNLVTFDMGGTSADFSLIIDSQPGLTHERAINGQVVRVPMLDIETISAGGGSIATVDHAGSLHIGPHSAGAVPGPACYSKGGTAATLTDAVAVLGILDPADFTGGDIRLDIERARAAIAKDVAGPLDISIEEAAFGMIAVACAQMRQAIRTLTVERGQDLRDFSLLAFGGAGSIFASFMERELGAEQILIPPRPGVFSALGLLMADVRHSAQAVFAGDLATISDQALKRAFDELFGKLEASLESDGIANEKRSYQQALDLRYKGQFHNLTVPLARAADGRVDIAAIEEAFDALHRQAFGHSNPGGTLEVVNLRMTAVGDVAKPTFNQIPPKTRAHPDPIGWREMLLDRTGSRQKCPVYARADLAPGDVMEGPAVISQSDTTVIILPRQIGRVDDFGVISIRSQGEPNVR